MERLTSPIRDLRQRPGFPSPGGRAATEDEGQRLLEDRGASRVSDKNPAGRLPYAPENEPDSPSSAGRDRAEGCAEDPALSAEQHHDSQVNTGRGAAQRAGSAEAPVEPRNSRRREVSLDVRLTVADRDAIRHRGRKDDPLYRARRTLHTGAGLLTDKQQTRLQELFVLEEHVPVEATWGIYQRMIAAYREKDRSLGRAAMEALIDAVSQDVPAGLDELRKLGRTLKARATDVLAYFERPGTSNGPTEAINGRLEHLRGSALGFRNLTNYIARSLLESGGFRPQLHPHL